MIQKGLNTLKYLRGEKEISLEKTLQGRKRTTL